jgi:tetratricopeptide (TPR) repeat protein
MIIIHRIDDFLFEIFPGSKENKEDIEKLKNDLERFYSTGPFKPFVSIDDDIVTIEFEDSIVSKHGEKYKSVIKLCENGNYKKAKQKLRFLIREEPQVSEYHRILGQILSDQGEQEKAIDTLVDALRWDPHNEWALIMMGNIFARDKDDVTTAMKYYEQASLNNPEDNIALNNIGATLMQVGRKDEALEYFNKALKLNSDYPNTYYALALLAEMEDDSENAFNNAIIALKKNTRKDGLFQNSIQLAVKSAKQIIATENCLSTVQAYATKLEYEYGTPIVIVEDSSIPTAAKMEYAENHGREKHIVKYKPEYPAIHHLMMHELVHLEFAAQAQELKKNMLFVSTGENKTSFIKSLESDAIKLNKKGLSTKTLAEYFESIFDGLNRQIFNTPLDLFIEDFLYEKYDDLKPYQFVSLLGMTQEGIQATTDKKVIELSPPKVLSQSKIYNIVNAIQFRNLYGVDLINEHKPTRSERQQAESFYQEYLEYKKKREPGQEYELVQHWADILKLNNNFRLIDEIEYRASASTEELIDSIGTPGLTSTRQDEMDTFMATHENKDLNMAVVMYMVDALQYFDNLDKSDIKRIAFDIANIGTKGIHPDSKDYTVPAIPRKQFTGYHLLAYYYVSWALVIPDMLKDLQLPFDKEYETAQEFDSR